MTEEININTEVTEAEAPEKPKKRVYTRRKKAAPAEEAAPAQTEEIKTEEIKEEAAETEISQPEPVSEAAEEAIPSDAEVPAAEGDASDIPADEGMQEEERPEVEGILEIAEDGFGFLRFDNFLTSSKDIYVSNSQIRRFGLRTGDKILGITRKPRANERFGALLYVKTVNGMDPVASKRRPHFDTLTPIFPNEKIVLETSSIDLSTRAYQNSFFHLQKLLKCHLKYL